MSADRVEYRGNASTLCELRWYSGEHRLLMLQRLARSMQCTMQPKPAEAEGTRPGSRWRRWRGMR